MEVIMAYSIGQIIDNAAGIRTILDTIHDCKIDKEKIVTDPINHILRLPFYREEWSQRTLAASYWLLKRWRVPVVEWVMKIYYANRYAIHEGNQEGPGSEDFINILTYDDSQNRIWISTTIAKGIEVHVDKLAIALEQSSKILYTTTRFTLSCAE